MTTYSLVTGSCSCSREIESVIPWSESISKSKPYVRCVECDAINAVEVKREWTQ